ncbi:MAG: DUF1801 domain-containing protein [Spirosomataceae bacterium]
MAKQIESVEEYISKLEPQRAELVNAIRLVVLASDNEVGEQIKWNAPSFFYTGAMAEFDPKEYKRDILVMNFNRKDHVLLVFPTGAKIDSSSEILEGDFKDGRKMVKIFDLDDLRNKSESLQKAIKRWLELVEK